MKNFVCCLHSKNDIFLGQFSISLLRKKKENCPEISKKYPSLKLSVLYFFLSELQIKATIQVVFCGLQGWYTKVLEVIQKNKIEVSENLGNLFINNKSLINVNSIW